MATAADRFHIVLSPDERRAWNGGAARLGVPTAEYVRRAVAAFEAGLSPAELDQLAALADEVELAAGRMTQRIDAAAAQVDRPFDEAAVRRAVAARLAADPVSIDPAILDFGAAGPAHRPA